MGTSLRDAVRRTAHAPRRTPADRDWQAKRSLPPSEVAAQLRALGVRDGETLLFHASYRAIRPAAGGPAGLIAGLLQALGPDGTLVMPSYTGNDDAPFYTGVTPANPDLGAVADTFWRLPCVERSDHPFAFAAAGPKAAAVTADPICFPPHGMKSPVGRVLELQGKLLLAGVGHESNTTIHLAEILAGVPYRMARHCTVISRGVALRVDYEENDHCCSRFSLAGDWLRTDGRQAEGRVGYAPA